PPLNARGVVDVKLVFRHVGPSGSCRPKSPRIDRFEVLDPLPQERFMIAVRLVSVGYEHEGWMISVGLQNPIGLVVEPLVYTAPFADIPPRAALHLKINARFVGCNESGLGRTPRVKADVVQSVFFDDPANPPPCGRVRGRIARSGENGALERPAQKRQASVDGKLGADGGELAQTKAHAALVGVRR